MIYIFVAVLVCSVAFVGWRLAGLQDSASNGQRVPDRRPRREAPKGPDDDPDFLRTLK
ncbi:hypothetical protein [Gordonia humi]|uniref:Uncharacterized protein n=1 Tax=Gordonia humi TaxID=686429 RepID=A0A840EW86_9ACTN|nr:hypothetical protein [Gordonia humi]MBB4134598.1 hypothetical protein [Gordonia humi]